MDAIVHTGKTATRTVFFSGLTVVMALVGMVLVPFNIFVGVGLGAIFVVMAAVLANGRTVIENAAREPDIVQLCEMLNMMGGNITGLNTSTLTIDGVQELHSAEITVIPDRIETGTFFMNRCDYLDPALPWVGVKDSGKGVSLSRIGIRNLTRPKSIHLKTE